MEQRRCPSCGAPVRDNEKNCRYCGEYLPSAAPVPPVNSPGYRPPNPPPYTAGPAVPPPPYGGAYPPPVYAPPVYPASNKSKVTAGVLGILLGGLGIHKFYLNKPGQGVLYLLFCWTGVPAIIGLIEGIIYLCADDQTFYYKYVL